MQTVSTSQKYKSRGPMLLQVRSKRKPNVQEFHLQLQPEKPQIPVRSAMASAQAPSPGFTAGSHYLAPLPCEKAAAHFSEPDRPEWSCMFYMPKSMETCYTSSRFVPCPWLCSLSEILLSYTEPTSLTLSFQRLTHTSVNSHTWVHIGRQWKRAKQITNI